MNTVPQARSPVLGSRSDNSLVFSVIPRNPVDPPRILAKTCNGIHFSQRPLHDKICLENTSFGVFSRWLGGLLLTGGSEVRILLAELELRLRNLATQQLTPQARRTSSRPRSFHPVFRVVLHSRTHRQTLRFERDNLRVREEPYGFLSHPEKLLRKVSESLVNNAPRVTSTVPFGTRFGHFKLGVCRRR